MDEAVSQLIDAALEEDIGPGDLTSEYFVPADAKVRAFVVARDDGVLAGTEVAVEVFRRVSPDIDVQVLVNEGAKVGKGAHVISLTGPARGVLTAERTALNFLQRLSGVATATRRYVDEIADASARILDTRKTTPGWRLLEKAAVVAGGGTNHRMGLYDRVMVKDNHLVAQHDTEALQAAIRRLKEEHPGVEVELEADRLEQVAIFLELEGVDHILLDNMSLMDLTEAVALRGDRLTPRLEASGGVTLETARSIAMTGVDFVSVGAITHSAVALDLGLDFVPLEEE
ncbi:quinolinate phosphoribosyl transferase [Haloferula helveola]|uniref:nicotinate-nucleotide diphosphorylase (carboxylating) n=1 Tax=Haloferula helveola TaxID=490095 RepID=A0ABM7R822_9BACT|nr:quinolinate phosphoribosyl transferase [Haloferula helveola]